MIWVYLGLSLLTIVLVSCLWLWYRHEAKREKADTEIIGEVVDYKYNKSGMFPKVEYEVDGKTYRRVLEYDMLITISTPFDSPKAQTENDPLDRIITIRRNSIFSFSGLMKHHFPLGTKLTVYYCKDNPKLSYVERYCGMKGFAFQSLFFVVYTMLLVMASVFCVDFYPEYENLIFLIIFPLVFIGMGIYFYNIIFRPIVRAKRSK